MAELNVKRVSLSFGATGAVLSAICGVAYVISPSIPVSFLNAIIHSTVTIQTPPVTVASFVVSLVTSFVGGALLGLIFAPIYNYLGGNSK